MNPLLQFLKDALAVHVGRPNFTAVQTALNAVAGDYPLDQQQEAYLALLQAEEELYKLDTLQDLVQKYRVKH